MFEFSSTNLEGKDKWTAYKLTKSVYRTWIPTHFKRLYPFLLLGLSTT